MKAKTTIKSVFGLAALLFAGSGMAALITPEFNPDTTACEYEGPAANCFARFGDDTSQPKLKELAALVGIDDEGLEILYKTGGEQGDFAESYTTVFIPNGGNASGGTITWDEGSYINCPVCYLWVKDGDHEPNLYVFDIGWWDGRKTLELEGFWLDEGAISNIGIFGREGGDMQVPEPATLGLLGLAALGLGLTRRRRLAG